MRSTKQQLYQPTVSLLRLPLGEVQGTETKVMQQVEGKARCTRLLLSVLAPLS